MALFGHPSWAHEEDDNDYYPPAPTPTPQPKARVSAYAVDGNKTAVFVIGSEKHTVTFHADGKVEHVSSVPSPGKIERHWL